VERPVDEEAFVVETDVRATQPERADMPPARPEPV